MEIEWSPKAKEQRWNARKEQPNFEALRKLERQIEQIEEQIALFPESAKMHPEFDRDDIRQLPVGRYRLSYMILEDRLLIISLVPAASGSALD